MASSRISGNKRTTLDSSFGSSPAFGQPGSSSFGQPGFSSFGAQPAFGQQNSAVNNSFAARPFGTTSPFGAQTGSTSFGGNSNGIFGATPSPSPVFGEFGSPNHAQSSPFEINSKIQPAFGSNRATPQFPQLAPATSSSLLPSIGFGSSFASASASGFSSFALASASSSPSIGFGSFTAAPAPTFGTSTPRFGSFASASTPTLGSSPIGFGSFASASRPSIGFGSFASASASASIPAFGSTPAPPFGATSASTPAFGSTLAPPFGATSTPAFGSSSASTPAFGTSPSTSPSTGFGRFASVPAFSATSTPVFGSSPDSPSIGFGRFASDSAFSATSTPVFESRSSNGPSIGFGSFASSSTSRAIGFGSFASAPAFGLAPNFGPAFGSSSSFGCTLSSFGVPTTFGSPGGGSRVAPYTMTISSGENLLSISAMPQYEKKSHEVLRWEDYELGDKGGPNLGSQQPAGGLFSQPTQSSPFGQTTTPSASPSSISPFGTSSPPVFGDTPVSQSSNFGSLFGSTPSLGPSLAFGSSNSFENNQSSTPTFSPNIPAFGQSQQAFGQSTPAFGTFGSTFSSSSGDAFGPSTTPASSPAFGATCFGQSSEPVSIFGSTPSLGSSPAFGSSTPFGNTQFQSSTPAFGQTMPAFGQSQPAIGQPTPAFGATSFGQSSEPGSLFGSTPSSGSSPTFGSNTPFGNTQSCGLFQSSTPMPAFGQSTPTFGIFGSTFGSSSSGVFGSSTTLAFGSNPSFGCTPSSFVASSFLDAASIPSFGQTTFGQHAQNMIVMVPQPVSNPFGILPPMPQMSIVQSAGSARIQYGISSMPAVNEKPLHVKTTPLWSVGSAPRIQYGISSMPVNKKPVHVKTTPLFTAPRIAPRPRIPMHSRRYNPKKNSPKVSFLNHHEEATSIPDAMFSIPRENPRALFIQPSKQSSPSMVLKPAVNFKEVAVPISDPGAMGQDGNGTWSIENDAFAQEPENAKENWPGGVKDANIQDNLLSSKPVDGPVKSSSRQNSSSQEQDHRGSDYISLSGHRVGEAAIVYVHGANIEALMPKLGHSDYYTEPKIQELAAKERAEPGYCQRVKDFVVGRKGYGSIKFFGESDVRQLDLDSIIQFNKCEISVYEMDVSKIPPLGQGLNKPAEITLLNLKYVNKKTGQHCTEGVVVDEFERKLKRKTERQGAEFMSYNAIKGVYKFRVKHFIPTPGQGLSKSAEMPLLNVKSADQHCTKGVEVDKSKKRLKRKTEDLGEEFMSDNGIEAKRKSRVKHFIPTPGQGLSKLAEMTLLNVKSVDQHCMKGMKVDKYEKRLKRKTKDLGEEFMSDNAIEADHKSCVKRCSQKGLDESGFWKIWTNSRELSMEYLKNKICN